MRSNTAQQDHQKAHNRAKTLTLLTEAGDMLQAAQALFTSQKTGIGAAATVPIGRRIRDQHDAVARLIADLSQHL